jgi:hypothetical protein
MAKAKAVKAEPVKQRQTADVDMLNSEVDSNDIDGRESDEESSEESDSSSEGEDVDEPVTEPTDRSAGTKKKDGKWP